MRMRVRMCNRNAGSEHLFPQTAFYREHLSGQAKLLPPSFSIAISVILGLSERARGRMLEEASKLCRDFLLNLRACPGAPVPNFEPSFYVGLVALITSLGATLGLHRTGLGKHIAFSVLVVSVFVLVASLPFGISFYFHKPVLPAVDSSLRPNTHSLAPPASATSLEAEQPLSPVELERRRIVDRYLSHHPNASLTEINEEYGRKVLDLARRQASAYEATHQARSLTERAAGLNKKLRERGLPATAHYDAPIGPLDKPCASHGIEIHADHSSIDDFEATGCFDRSGIYIDGTGNQISHMRVQSTPNSPR